MVQVGSVGVDGEDPVGVAGLVEVGNRDDVVMRLDDGLVVIEFEQRAVVQLLIGDGGALAAVVLRSELTVAGGGTVVVGFPLDGGAGSGDGAVELVEIINRWC